MILHDFESKLTAELAGKEFGTYSWQYTVLNAVVKLLEEAGINYEKKLSYHQYNKGNTLYIQYDHKVNVLCIEVKKKRGEYQPCRWGKGSYEWVFGNCIVWDCQSHATLEEAWEAAMKFYAKTMDSEAIRLERSIKTINWVRETFGGSEWDAQSLIKYISSNWYTLSGLAEKRLKEAK